MVLTQETRAIFTSRRTIQPNFQTDACALESFLHEHETILSSMPDPEPFGIAEMAFVVYC